MYISLLENGEMGFRGDFQVQWKVVEFFAQESRLRLCQFYKSLKKIDACAIRVFALVHVLWSRVIGHFVTSWVGLLLTHSVEESHSHQ
jgi:hypothetical protein